uniref:Uncharacterized protein n=1 Tax=Cyprinus carpio carpio TaxID=630221 RepID=A0A8C1CJ61_CYPCA
IDVSVRNDAKTCSKVIDQSASGTLPRLRSTDCPDPPSPDESSLSGCRASTAGGSWTSVFLLPLLVNFLPTSPMRSRSSCSMGSSLNML